LHAIPARILRAMLTGLAALALAAPQARAHPHVFIDGGVDFLFDAEGRLADLRVTWIYDPLTSLFLLVDLGIAATEDAELTPDERARLAASQTEWVAGYDGDAYLRRGGVTVGLSGPNGPDAGLRDGRVAIGFSRALAEPFRPGEGAVVEVYDPTYFTAYVVTETPRLEGRAVGCRARVQPYAPSGPLAALQRSLSAIGVDETPPEDFGALFADKVHVTCD
jgi:ABC-type uncharacterized transport system substrate-binding protein